MTITVSFRCGNDKPTLFASLELLTQQLRLKLSPQKKSWKGRVMCVGIPNDVVAIFDVKTQETVSTIFLPGLLKSTRHATFLLVASIIQIRDERYVIGTRYDRFYVYDSNTEHVFFVLTRSNDCSSVFELKNAKVAVSTKTSIEVYNLNWELEKEVLSEFKEGKALFYTQDGKLAAVGSMAVIFYDDKFNVLYKTKFNDVFVLLIGMRV